MRSTGLLNPLFRLDDSTFFWTSTLTGQEKQQTFALKYLKAIPTPTCTYKPALSP